MQIRGKRQAIRQSGNGQAWSCPRWFLALVLLILPLALPGTSAAAPAHTVLSTACLTSSNTPIPARAIQTLPVSAWRCGTIQPSPGQANHWLRISGKGDPFAAGEVRLETDAMPIDLLTIVAVDHRGKAEIRRFDAESLLPFWTSGSRLSVPLPMAGGDIVTLYVGVERPLSSRFLTTIRLVPVKVATAGIVSRSNLFALSLGLTLMPVFYSLALFMVLRQPFALAHAAMTGFFALSTLASSSLMLTIVPSIDQSSLTVANYVSLALGMAAAPLFMISFLEANMVGPKMRTLLLASSAILLVNAATFPWMMGRSFEIIRIVYHAAFIPAVAVAITAVVVALRRGSKAVWFIIGGWSVPICLAFDRIFRGFDLYTLSFEADFAFNIALAIEAIVTAIGVAWRFDAIRSERDHAILRNAELARIAETDGLTGLANRRHFEAVQALDAGFLATIDIDHFKALNDNHGHLLGDDVLRAVGRAITNAKEDGFCTIGWRLGGDEFAMLINAQRPHDAALFANQLRQMIEREVAQVVSTTKTAISVSIGVAACVAHDVVASYAAADRALYRAKAAGRGCVAFDEPAMPLAQTTDTNRRAA